MPVNQVQTTDADHLKQISKKQNQKENQNKNLPQQTTIITKPDKTPVVSEYIQTEGRLGFSMVHLQTSFP